MLQLFTYTLLILSCCIAFSAFLFSLIYLILTSRPVAPSESAVKCYFQFSRSYFESAYSNDIELYGKRLDTDSYSCGLGCQFLLVELTDWCKQIIYRLCVTCDDLSSRVYCHTALFAFIQIEYYFGTIILLFKRSLLLNALS